MLKEQLVEDRDGKEPGRQKRSRKENEEASKKSCEVQSLNEQWIERWELYDSLAKGIQKSTNMDKCSMMWLHRIIMKLNEGAKLKEKRQLEFQTSYSR